MTLDSARLSSVLPLELMPVQANPVEQIPTQADLVIVGGGIVGATLACALADQALQVVVVEAKPQGWGLENRRAYALTLLTADIFTGLGLWTALRSQITGFTQIALSDGFYSQVVKFIPQDLTQDLKRSELGYVAEHRVILQVLYDRLRSSKNVTWLAPAQVERVTYPDQEVSGRSTSIFGTSGSGTSGSGTSGSGTSIAQVNAQVNIRLANQETLTIETPLVVAADGSNSPLRQAAGLQTWGWKYWQSCIGFTVRGDRPHDHIAYEKFCTSGPFAILPLTDQRCQVVWTAPHEEAEALVRLNDEAFLEVLTQRYGTQGGALHLETRPQVFPVRLMQGKSYVRSRLALVGDAAHCCHPVGGQGMNLGIRDAVALAEVILHAQHKNEDWGSLRVLQRYDRWRRWENWVILAFTDFLDRCFSNEFPPIVILRRLGILGLCHIQPLRYFALLLMTGQLGRKPKVYGSPGSPCNCLRETIKS